MSRHFSDAILLTLYLEPEMRMAESETIICVHKFACTTVTKKKKNGAQTLPHAALRISNNL